MHYVSVMSDTQCDILKTVPWHGAFCMLSIHDPVYSGGAASYSSRVLRFAHPPERLGDHELTGTEHKTMNSKPRLRPCHDQKLRLCSHRKSCVAVSCRSRMPRFAVVAKYSRPPARSHGLAIPTMQCDVLKTVPWYIVAKRCQIAAECCRHDQIIVHHKADTSLKPSCHACCPPDAG